MSRLHGHPDDDGHHQLWHLLIVVIWFLAGLIFGLGLPEWFR